jgi:WD40 repeat protein/serine/threonine protein kinase
MDEESIFLEALQKPSPAERMAYLEEACAGRAELRHNVLGLLHAHERAGDFLGEVPGVATVDHPTSEGPDTVLGPYKLLEPIGEGGFGVVFMAEQLRPVRRKVALKVLKPGMDTRQVIARFEAERQALALMDHPNIARIFDGGTTPASPPHQGVAGGRPYFVMELVRGIPITDYCDQNHFTIRERLGLFGNVCEAIQHAHQKGVIHRDIKPSNVMVTLHDGTPVVKVIDFGIAKATGGQLTDKTLFTNFAQLIGTPMYMSPEQAQLSGLDMDTRSDIYSLGVLLYELLTGLTPFDQARLETASYDEIRRIILEEEPARPSTRVSTLGQAGNTASARRKSDPQQLCRLFRGELDWIVMKALEKDRNRRYESAAAFAADVQRYLNDEQVLAHPPSTWYRVGKFVRRNRVRVVTAASVALGLMLALGGLVTAVLVQSASNASIRVEQTQTKGALAREKKAHDELKRVVVEKEQDLYFQSIALAERQWAANNGRRAEELLADCRPELRGWEWDYLKRLRAGAIPPLRHDAPVYGVAISPQGDRLATSDNKGGLTVWDARTLQRLWHTQAHRGVVWAVAVSPEGTRLATAGTDAESCVKVWDTASGRLLRALKGQPGERQATGVAFSPDGRRVAASLQSSSIRVWDAATGELVVTLPSHDVWQLAVSGDGRQIASAPGDYVGSVWDVATGSVVLRLPGNQPAWCVAYSPDGRWIAFGGGMHARRDNGQIKIWDAKTGKERHTLHGHVAMVNAVSFSPDSKRVVSASADQSIKLWDVGTGRETLELRGHRNVVAVAAFGPDGRLFSGGDDGTVMIWDGRPWHDGEGGQELLTLSGHGETVAAVAFSPDGRLLASADCAGIVKLWPLWTRGEPRTLRGSSEGAYGLAFSPHGRHFAAAGGEGLLRIWEVATGREVRDIQPESTTTAMSVAYSPDGRSLAFSGWGIGVDIRDVATGGSLHKLEAYRGSAPNALAFHPNAGRFLVSAGDEGTVRVWDAADGRELRQLGPQRAGASRGVAFSRDGRLLAACGWDRAVHLWETANADPALWTPSDTLSDPTSAIECVAVSPDGRLVAWGGTDSILKVWDRVRRVTHTRHGHLGWLRSLAFSPDGRCIASGSQDTTVKLWNASFDEDARRQ